MAGAVPGERRVSGKGEQMQVHGWSSQHQQGSCRDRDAADTWLRAKNCWISLPCLPAAGNSLSKPQKKKKNPCKRSRAGRWRGSVCWEGRAGCAGMRLWLFPGILSTLPVLDSAMASMQNPQILSPAPQQDPGAWEGWWTHLGLSQSAEQPHPKLGLLQGVAG